MVLARYFAYAHPASRQLIVEPNRAMTEAVLARVSFPADAKLTLRHELGRPVIEELPANSADLIVVDAFAGGHVPEDLTTAECVTRLNCALRDEGILVYGLIDHPDMQYVARVCATIRAATPLRMTVMSPHHPYFGNYTLLCTRGDALTEDVLSTVTTVDSGYVRCTAARLDSICEAADVLTDASPKPSPDPPSETLGASW
ncbi:hypothetical protein LX12_000420 [Williamsia serinedens]|uniref:Spermidine synthase n=2 Tax=Williamsia serinedens TaxID=391736 RepID=A0ABT1GWJ9_9NOCA|nr:hypothetical protein [Williamsia serinedens]